MSLRKREKELAPELNEDDANNKNGDNRGDNEITSNKKVNRSKIFANKKILRNVNSSDDEDDEDDKKSNKSSKSKKSVSPTGDIPDARDDNDSGVSDHDEEPSTIKNIKNKSVNTKKTKSNVVDEVEEEVQEEDNDEDGDNKKASSPKAKKADLNDSINYENSDDDEPLIKNVKSNTKDKKKSNKKSVKNSKTDNAKTKKAANNDDEDKDEEGGDVDDDDDEEEDYEVEKIINHKYQKGKLFYEIRWKGYEESDNTWEPESTLSCPDLIKKYREINPDMDKPPTKKRNHGKKGDSKSNTGKRQKKTNGSGGDDEEEETWDENKDFEVKSIQDVSFKRDGSRKFLIRWVGYSANDDTWEPEEHLQCEELIKRYMEKVNESKNANQVELRVVRKHTERFTLKDEQSNRRISKRRNGRQRISYFDAE